MYAVIKKKMSHCDLSVIPKAKHRNLKQSFGDMVLLTSRARQISKFNGQFAVTFFFLAEMSEIS